jgi:hypothetical protein
MGKFSEFAARHREKAKEQMQKAIAAVEVVGASGGIAYLNHRFGAGEIKLGAAKDGTGGVPLDGSLFLVGHLLGFMGTGGSKYTPHLHNLANGFGAGFAYRTGADLGDKAAATAAAGGTATTSGQLVGGQLVGAPQLAPYFAKWGHHPQSVGWQSHRHWGAGAG